MVRMIARACFVIGLCLSSVAHAQRSPVEVEPGVRLGAVRIGMTEQALAALGLPRTPPGPGVPARFGPYRVLFERGVVDRVGVRAGDVELRASARVLRADALIGSFRHCVQRERGSTECEGNGVRIEPGASPEDVELWVQARPDPIVIAPGQLGAVRIGMTEAELRALPNLYENFPGSFHLRGITIEVRNGRVVRLHATLSSFGRIRVGDRVADEGAPDRDALFGGCRPLPVSQAAEMTARSCGGAVFTRGLGTDEEVTIERHE